MIKIYSMEHCPKCKILKEKMDKNNIYFKEMNIDKDEEAREYIIGKGLTAMPVIECGALFVNGDSALRFDIEKLKGYRD